MKKNIIYTLLINLIFLSSTAMAATEVVEPSFEVMTPEDIGIMEILNPKMVNGDTNNQEVDIKENTNSTHETNTIVKNNINVNPITTITHDNNSEHNLSRQNEKMNKIVIFYKYVVPNMTNTKFVDGLKMFEKDTGIKITKVKFKTIQGQKLQEILAKENMTVWISDKPLLSKENNNSNNYVLLPELNTSFNNTLKASNKNMETKSQLEHDNKINEKEKTIILMNNAAIDNKEKINDSSILVKTANGTISIFQMISE